DHEIFDLVDQLTGFEGEDATFYSLLGVEPTASVKEIGKAHRKLSLALHPDKNPDERSRKLYALLGSITTILRNPESRERYHFFLRNGVPKWRGTGWYYNRYRPGLPGVIAREIAWGKRMKKQNTRKRVCVNEKQFIVDSDNVLFLTDEGEEFLLSEEEVSKPSFGKLFPVLIYKSILSKLIAEKKQNIKMGESGDDQEPFSSDDERSEAGDNPSQTRRRRPGRKAKS
ncbi:1731_t:CDS:2, partial [Racocetra persica]